MFKIISTAAIATVALLGLAACSDEFMASPVPEPTLEYDPFLKATKLSSGDQCFDNRYWIAESITHVGAETLCFRIDLLYDGKITEKDISEWGSEAAARNAADSIFLTVTFKADDWMFVDRVVMLVDGEPLEVIGELENRRTADTNFQGYTRIEEYSTVELIKGTKLYNFFFFGDGASEVGFAVRVYGEHGYLEFNDTNTFRSIY
jgi:hypothetical protein